MAIISWKKFNFPNLESGIQLDDTKSLILSSIGIKSNNYI